MENDKNYHLQMNQQARIEHQLLNNMQDRKGAFECHASQAVPYMDQSVASTLSSKSNGIGKVRQTRTSMLRNQAAKNQKYYHQQ